MKYELGVQIMKAFVVLRKKTNNYLKDNNNDDKKAKGPKKSGKESLNFKNIKTVQKQLKLKIK